MNKEEKINTKNNLKKNFETFFWVLIIIATVVVATQFSWDKAFSILQYILAVGALASVYFYLNSRTLYAESQKKTTELIKKQRELTENQKALNLIFENSADGILILDQEKRIEYFSPGMEKISGFKKEEAIGHLAQNLLQFQAEKDKSLLPDLMFTTKGVSANSPYLKNSLVNKDGKVIDIEASYALSAGSTGKEIRALAIIRDVSYEKILMERDKEFIAVTSHQLNTPLSIIRGYSSLLLSGKAGKMNQKTIEYLDEIRKSSQKMIALTNNMLSIARIEQDKIKLEIKDINIKDSIDSIIKMFSERAKEKNLNLSAPETNKDLVIMADQDKINQTITNLIDNAIKYTKKGSIKISLVERAEEIDIIIEDTGIGIPDEEIEKIGSRFFRTQEAIDVDNHGTGLGVFIAKTIVEKHHGRFKIESKIGKGTKITLTLPKIQTIN